MGVLAVIALLAFGVFGTESAKLEPGDEVPAADLELLAPGDSPVAGQSASIEDFRGRWVLLNVWASWCGPCEDESPDLVAFQDEYGSDDGFTILGVQTQDGTDEGLDFVAEYELNYPSIRDGSGDYADELGMTGVPETILIDPEGRVAYTRPGQIDAEILAAEVAPLIADSRAAAGAEK